MTTERRPVRIGSDIGGTFTDIEIYDARSGRIHAHKVATTPEDPSIGLIAGVKEAAARFGFTLGDIGYLLHGTTIATNAVLERKFPKAALVTTARFEDVLEIARHNRREVYSVWPRPAPVLIPRNLRLGVAERVAASGAVTAELTEAALDDLVAKLRPLGVATVAVSLINAYLNPVHERAIKARLARDLPHLTVSISSDVSPEIREYERTNTTALNALLMPVVKGYLDRLERRLTEEGIAARLLIVQSNGAVCSPATAAEEPVRLLLSGPSGGALAALSLARALKIPALVGVDMGGTSFDVSVVRDDRIEIVTQGEIDRLPVRVPMIEIRTIGAGGGSIARVAPGGRLTVGPESAGARPGPVCYGRGGSEPTVTDANLLLGRLEPAYFLGGKMPLDLAASRAAVSARVAEPLGLTPEAAVEGIITITNASLAAAIRLSLFEKGLDPRDFTLLSFGGAGSIHAAAVAEELGISRIIFPADASTFSAWGILHSDIGHDLARSRVMPFDDAAAGAITDMLAALTADARARLDADDIPARDREMRIAADLRYKGQAFELTVPWRGPVSLSPWSAAERGEGRGEGQPQAAVPVAAPHPSPLPASGEREAIAAAVRATREAFHALHKQRFSYSNPHDVVELVTLRMTAVGRLPRPTSSTTAAPITFDAPRTRQVWLDGTPRCVPVLRRSALAPGARLDGPAVVEEDYTTVLVPAGWSAVMGASGHLVATRATGGRP